MYYFRHCI